MLGFCAACAAAVAPLSARAHGGAESAGGEERARIGSIRMPADPESLGTGGIVAVSPGAPLGAVSNPALAGAQTSVWAVQGAAAFHPDGRGASLAGAVGWRGGSRLERYGVVAYAAGLSTASDRTLASAAPAVASGLAPAAAFGGLAVHYRTGILAVGASAALSAEGYAAPLDEYGRAAELAEFTGTIGTALFMPRTRIGVAVRDLGSEHVAGSVEAGAASDMPPPLPATLAVRWSIPTQHGGVHHAAAGAALPVLPGVALLAGAGVARGAVTASAGIRVRLAGVALAYALHYDAAEGHGHVTHAAGIATSAGGSASP